MRQTVEFVKLTDTAHIPTRESVTAAGFDLYADIPCNCCIDPHQTLKISTGIAIAAPEGTFAGIFARSGIASKEGLRPANCVGVVDSDYRGAVIVAMHNDSDYPHMIEPGQRIAQLIIIPHLEFDFVEVDKLNETERGNNGFGSSGK